MRIAVVVNSAVNFGGQLLLSTPAGNSGNRCGSKRTCSSGRRAAMQRRPEELAAKHDSQS